MASGLADIAYSQLTRQAGLADVSQAGCTGVMSLTPDPLLHLRAEPVTGLQQRGPQAWLQQLAVVFS